MNISPIFIFVLLVYLQPNGSIRGTFVDAATKKGLRSGKITISGSSRSTFSNEQGEFRLEHLPPGRYSLMATLQGYAPVFIKDVQVQSDSVTIVVIPTFVLKHNEPKIKIYRPDSSINYKMRIFNPEKRNVILVDSLKQ